MMRTLVGEASDFVGGLLFGAIDVALMLPLEFEDRATAFAAAFASRFAIGILAATTQLPLPAAPILATGVIGGTLIGWTAENTRARTMATRIRKREQVSARRWHLEVRLSDPRQVDAEIECRIGQAF